MEKYSPKYSNELLKNVPVLFRPFYALKLKNLYDDIDIKNKNSDLLKVAKDVKNSINNYQPYYFYIAYAYYFPDIRNSIQAAINDGCSEISIINYTNKSKLENELDGRINLQQLTNNGLKVNFTRSVYEMPSFSDGVISQISNLTSKWDGILIIDSNTETSGNIKSKLLKMGYEDNNIIITTDINTAMDYCRKNKLNNILYVNLTDSSGSYKSETILPGKFVKFGRDMKITGLNSWGYDKNIVKAVIEAVKK